MLPERAETLRRTLAMRTRYVTICTENMFHPHNASALLRNCDAFGVQEMHAVQELCDFKPNKMIVRGTDQWIDLHRHPSTADALAGLRQRGYRIVATTPRRGDFTPEDFPVEEAPFALLLGTEHAGITPETLDAADAFLQIPMCGFVESLNVSASAAVMLYILTRRLRRSEVAWQLTGEDAAEVLFRWMIATVRDAERILGVRFKDEELL